MADPRNITARPPSTNGWRTASEPQFVINAQNCVHCKTCDIKDPNQNIDWTTPEGRRRSELRQYVRKWPCCAAIGLRAGAASITRA